MNLRIGGGISFISHDYFGQEEATEKSSDNIDEELNPCEESFMEGFYSDELPSEAIKRRIDPFFPNHF